jgi:hypothetical protein
MKLSTKERQQCNAKLTRILKNAQQRARRLAKTTERHREKLRSQADDSKKAKQEIEQLKIENQLLRMEVQQQDESGQRRHGFEQVERFCNERGITNHTFGARMITLCVNLARRMSFRSVAAALSLVFDALGLSIVVPSHDSIEHWCKRVGLDQLKRTRDWHKDWLWIVDHSNQIGQEKVLMILGISASRLPPPGETLSLDQLEVLAIVPGKSWKRDDVRRVYCEVAEHCGTPRYVVCDGAVELRETVDVLEKPGKQVVVLRDFKHFAANRFEKLVGNGERFKSFCLAMGKTRCQVQQTELAHLTPPSLKTKARFMNIAPVVRWGRLILTQLENPLEKTVADADVSRLREKLGWVEAYRHEIESWGRCCELIDDSLHWINTQGLNRDSGVRLEEFLDSSRSWDRGSMEGRVRTDLIGFVHQSAAQLCDGERAWLSSESIESAFGRYKCREFQHSRSGFTGLIVSLPSMLRTWMPEQVRKSLGRVTNQDVRNWIAEKIGRTVAGRRAQAYRAMQNTLRNLKFAA